MNFAQHQVFPFFNYYPMLFCNPWSNSTTFQSQKLPIQPKTSQGSLSLLRGFQSPSKNEGKEAKPDPKPTTQLTNKMAQKSKLKKKKVREDVQQEREEDYSRKHQKKDRNLPSNIFKILSNFIYSNSRLAGYLARHCVGQLGANPSTVMEKFKAAVGNTQSYIRPATIQSLCREGKMTSEESRAFRILVKKFLLEQFPVIITQQPKLKKSQKTTYLKLARTLQHQLTEGFFQ